MAALSGRTIALPETRELDRLAQLLTEEGAKTLRCPLIAIKDAPDQRPVEAWLRAQARQRVPGVVRAPQPAQPLAGPRPPPRSPVDLPRLIDHRGAGRRVGAVRRRDRAIDAEDARPPPGRRWLPVTSTVSVRNLGSQGIPAGSTHTWPAARPPPSRTPPRTGHRLRSPGSPSNEQRRGQFPRRWCRPAPWRVNPPTPGAVVESCCRSARCLRL